MPSSAGDGDVSVGDRVKLPLTFDVTKMQEDLLGLRLGNFIQYSVLPLTAPAVAPSAPVEDFADGSWTDWLDTPLLESCPYLSSVVATFRSHTTVTLVRLLRLAPGGFIKEHTDPTLGLEVPKSVIRLTVPILTNDGAELVLNGVPVPMQPGDCWYLRFTDPHAVVNDGPTERVHLSIDMVPNEWVRSLINGRGDRP